MVSKSTNGHGHVNGNGAMEVDGQDGEDKKTRFRRVYMETLVKGFGKDLEKIREVCPISFLPFLSFPLSPFTPFFRPQFSDQSAWMDANDRLIQPSDLVECNYSSILYQPVSLAYMRREYADSKVRRYMSTESMVKMVWTRLA